MASKKKVPATTPADSGGGTPAPAELPVDAITKLEVFLEKNWKIVVTILAIVVLAVIVYFYMKYKREDTVTKANNVFMAAETRADLEAVIKKHPGTAAAGSALYSIADRQMAAQELDGAASSLKKFIADYPDHGLYYNALLGLGGILEKQGKLDEANGYFQQVVDAGDESPLAPLAAIRQTEILVAKGELEKAQEAYEAFGVNYSGSAFIPKATERLEAVKERIALKAAPEAPVEPVPESEKKAEETTTDPDGAKKTTDPENTDDTSKKSDAADPESPPKPAETPEPAESTEPESTTPDVTEPENAEPDATTPETGEESTPPETTEAGGEPDSGSSNSETGAE